jgi:hypothetical protein
MLAPAGSRTRPGAPADTLQQQFSVLQVMIAFVLGVVLGGCFISGADCDWQLYNPLSFWRALGALQRSPWSWAFPELSSVVYNLRGEVAIGACCTSASAIAFVYGGPAAGLAVLRLSTSMSGASATNRVLQAVHQVAASSEEDEPEWVESKVRKPRHRGTRAVEPSRKDLGLQQGCRYLTMDNGSSDGGAGTQIMLLPKA